MLAWFLDLAFGDPSWLPHPVVGFGKMIAWGERHLNKGRHHMLKGAIMTILLDSIVFLATFYILTLLPPLGRAGVGFITIFYCLAGTTLIREVRAVFLALDRSLDDGRRQVARIVGRDTTQLSAQEVRTAALETLAENLSDGVIAPLFWLAVGGVPAMLTYKMINTQDSMIGYRTERYKDFGCWAAHIDDIANYIPARLTALLMIIVPTHSPLEPPPTPSQGGGMNRQATNEKEEIIQAVVPNTEVEKDETNNNEVAHAPSLGGGRGRFHFIRRYGRAHASPNSGYPEAALASILNCRFGGPHSYFGEMVEKPYIGNNDRPLTTADMRVAVRVNRTVECIAVILCAIVLLI